MAAQIAVVVTPFTSTVSGFIPAKKDSMNQTSLQINLPMFDWGVKI